MKKINISNLILIAIYYLSMLSIMFLRWYKNIDITPKVVSIGMLIIILLDLKKIEKKDFVLISVFSIYIIINLIISLILHNNDNSYIYESLVNDTIIPFFSVLYVNKLIKKEQTLKKYILNPSFIILNIYYIFNFIIIIKQIKNPNFMLRNYSSNTFYMDHIAGLIGCNGTHKLAFFQLLCLYINYTFFKDKNKLINKLSKVLFIFILITSFYTSIYNDNRMYYFLTLLFFIPFIFFKEKKNKKKCINFKTILKKICPALLIITVFLTVYTTNEKFNTIAKQEIYDKYIKRTFEKISGSTNNSINSKEERIELLKYSIENGGLLGKGIGNIKKNQTENIPKHFGLNDMNIRIYNGGIIFALLIILLYTHFYNKMLNKKSYGIYIFISLLITSIYFQPFAYVSQSMQVSLMYLILAYELNKQNKEGII